jgi:hypothetical protein
MLSPIILIRKYIRLDVYTALLCLRFSTNTLRFHGTLKEVHYKTEHLSSFRPVIANARFRLNLGDPLQKVLLGFHLVPHRCNEYYTFYQSQIRQISQKDLIV